MSLMPIVAPFSDPPLFLAEVSTNGAFPTVMDGDLGILLRCHSVYGFASQAEVPFMAPAPGFSQLFSHAASYSRAGLWGRVTCDIRGRRLTSDLSGSSLGSEAIANTLLVFRHPRGRPVSAQSEKPIESTPAFNGNIQFGVQVSPIIPLFMASKILFGSGNVLLEQSQPAILFDGSPVTYYGASITGAAIRAAFLTGPQSPRSIAVSLDAANPGGNLQFTRHTAFSLRRSTD